MSQTNTETKTQVAFDQKELDALTTTSSKVRYLAGKGMERGQIAKTLGIRYQHVRNVLVTPLKKQGK